MFKLKKKHTLFYNIYTYFIWAIISAFIFLLITNTYYLYVLQDQTKENYSHNLERLSTSIEATFEEINRTVTLFTISNELEKILTTKMPLKYNEFSKVVTAVEALQKFTQTKSFIQDAFVINKEENIVIGNKGTSTIEEYFSILSNYTKYSKDFWLSLDSQSAKQVVLAPSVVTNSVTKQSDEYIPMAIFATNDRTYTSTLIVNIKLSYMVDLFNQNSLSPNSEIFAYRKGSGIITRSDNETKNSFTDMQLIELANSNMNETSKVTKLNGKRYLVVLTKNEATSIYFCAVTPYSDLTKESFSILRVPVLIFSFGIILVTIISFFLSKKIYTPIHNVTERLRENYKMDLDHKNELDFLNQSVQNIILDNNKLREDLNLAIPYVCERYLLSLFEDSEILKEEEVTKFLAQYDFTFPHNHFIVVQSILNFSEEFFDTHSKAEYNALCQASLLIANEAFSSIEDRYIFSVAINHICVVLNLPEESEKSKIAASILKYHRALDIDDTVMVVHSGVGRVYEGLNGLKKSYTESMEACSQLTYMTSSMVRTYSQTDEVISNSHYTLEEENHLINFLLQGDRSKVLSLLDLILKQNMDSNIGVHALKELYLRIHNTGIRVINRRHLSIYDLMGEDYINISSHIGDLATDDLYNYTKLVLVKIMDLTSKKNQQSDITMIKQYLDDHYDEEIYLDSIAEQFNKSSKYMSKYIKNALGVSFQEYISTLRIEKAKDLLMTTKKSINSISEEVGFNSRHPFIRKFKILEGVTPTEFRKLHKL